MMTDGSESGIGGVLMQESIDGDGWDTVCVYSRHLKQYEKHYSPTEFEMYAFKTCCTQWEKYLIGRPFVAMIDHKNLQFIFNNAKPQKNKKLAHWKQEIQHFDFTIVQKPSAEMIPADYLSRYANDMDWDPFAPFFRVDTLLFFSLCGLTGKKVKRKLKHISTSNTRPLPPLRGVKPVQKASNRSRKRARIRSYGAPKTGIWRPKPKTKTVRMSTVPLDKHEQFQFEPESETEHKGPTAEEEKQAVEPKTSGGARRKPRRLPQWIRKRQPRKANVSTTARRAPTTRTTKPINTDAMSVQQHANHSEPKPPTVHLPRKGTDESKQRVHERFGLPMNLSQGPIQVPQDATWHGTTHTPSIVEVAESELPDPQQPSMGLTVN